MLRVAKRECENEMDSMATMLMEEETKYINRLEVNEMSLFFSFA